MNKVLNRRDNQSLAGATSAGAVRTLPPVKSSMLRQWKWRLLGATALTAVVGAFTPAIAGGYVLRGIASPGSAAAVQAVQAASSAAAQAAASKQAAALAAAAQAITAARQSQNIARSTFVLNLPTNLGTDPRNPGQQLPNVTNGLGAGGLVPANTADPTQWKGASSTIVETVNGNSVTDTITQTSQKAVLDWTSFNIGANTTVQFVQGDASWSVLNRITGPSTSPTQILGQIKAVGGVYIINQNGIIFGGGTQINVGSLIASSLDVGDVTMTRQDRDNFYLNNGIASQATVSGTSTFIRSFSSTLIGTGKIEGDVTVQPGASITATGAGTSTNEPGFIYLFGPNVNNQGALTAPAGGEVALVAARGVALVPNIYDSYENGIQSGNYPVTSIRGTSFSISADISPGGAGTALTSYAAGTGNVTNSGLITTPAGITILNGNVIKMDGVISADTSISRNSQVFIDAVTSVNLSGTISILPLDNGDTALPWGGSSSSSSSSVATFAAPTVSITGYQVDLAPTALISAPGATVNVAALATNFQITPTLSALTSGSTAERILLEPGATIDVSGLENVQLPADYNIVTFKVTGTELANDPLQRNGVLNGQYISVDMRNTGTNSDGTTWIGTPVADASGFVSLVGRSIEQLLTTGGSVNFATTSTPGGAITSGSQVILSKGASINVAGGYVSYQGGMVPTTLLVGSDGNVYNIANANPNITYTSIIGQFVVADSRWGAAATRTFVSKFTDVYSPAYVEGYSAGNVSIAGASIANNADLQFGAVIGSRQAALGLGSGTAVTYPVQARDLIPSQGGLSLTVPQSVLISDQTGNVTTDYGGAAFQPANTTNVLQLSASQLNGYGLSNLSITANDLYIPVGTTVTTASGGSFTATTAGAIDVEGGIVARGGSITLTTNSFQLTKNPLFQTSLTASGDVSQSNITVGGTLDVRGLWVNDTGLTLLTEQGPGFINGGSITLKTVDGSTNNGGVALTGNIDLASGSVLDASSGGYIGITGSAKLASSGTLAGSGGNITLETFQGAFDPQGGTGAIPYGSGITADSVVTLGGSLSSYGFAGGGTLTISTPSFQIGGTPTGDPNTLYLATSFFSRGGFGSYVLSTPNDSQAFAQSITVAPNATVTLQQQNFATAANYLGVQTGANVGDFAAVVTLPADQRKAVNLTLQTGASGASGNIVLGAGSVIAADPGAKITFDVGNKTGSLQILGSIIDHGGTVVAEAPTVHFGAAALVDLSGFLISSSSFGLGQPALQSGTLLAGGTITIDTTATGGSSVTGAVTADAGAVIDVSGAAATIQGYTNTDTTSRQVISVASWSDAGTVNITTGSMAWNGTFRADAGAAQGNRGTLNLGGNTISLVSSMSNLAGADGTKTIVAAAEQLAAFDSVYLFAGAYDPATPLTGGLGFVSTQIPVPAGGSTPSLARIPTAAALNVYGDVDLNVRNRLTIYAQSISDATQSGSDVKMSANYVLLSTSATNATTPVSGTRNLTISAQSLDVQGAVFNKFLDVTLASASDIRLMAPPVNDGVTTNAQQQVVNPTTFFGQIAAGGNLTLSAQRIYPTTAVDFAIDVTGSGTDTHGNTLGTVTFTSPTGPDTAVPLSAGGSLTVSAATIVQNGNLFAPLGKISLGAQTAADLSPNDPRTTVVPTASVTLGNGSVTSVSLGGQTVPYGQTEDGVNWFYNSDASPLTGPPTKSVQLKGAAVSMASGALVDLSGGGDLQAFEFISGKGGTRDVLSNLVSTTDSKGNPSYSYTSAAVYAILPSSGPQPSVAASDIHFTSYLGDRAPLAGQQVYLNGGGGLAAGWYTLYPAHYATLPGAYRVVDYGSALASPGVAGSTLPDGTLIMGGAFGQASLGLRASGTELFSVQSSAVWQQYTQVSPSSANSYFLASAGHVPVTPVLPIDGGRLSIAATQSLTINATIASQPASGGSGGELDISGSKIDIVDGGIAPLAGYLGVQVGQIEGLGFESILFGGFRTDLASGTLITPTATDVRVDLTTTALSAPEIILVAAPAVASATATAAYSGSGAPASFQVASLQSGTGNITIASGEVTATGSTGADRGRSYILGNSSLAALASQLGGTLSTASGSPVISGVTYAATSTSTQQSTASVISKFLAASASGDGALFMVSNAANATVTRNMLPAGGFTVQFVTSTGATSAYSLSVPTTSPGTLTIGAGAIAGAAPGSTNQPATMFLSATSQSGAIVVQSGAVLGALSTTVSAPSIAIGDNTGSTDAVLIGHDLMSQISQGSLTLQAMSGNIDFYTYQNIPYCSTGCQIAIGDGVGLHNLTLDGAALIGHGTTVRIDAAGKVTLLNSGTAAASTFDVPQFAGSPVPSSLVIAGSEVDLAGGSSSINGFTEVDLLASQQVFVKGAGSLTLGSSATGATPVNLVIQTPNLLVGTATGNGSGSTSQFALTTLGNFLLQGNGSAPAATSQIGGNIAITAADIEFQQASLEALSGTVSLHATGASNANRTSGNILLGDSSYIAAGGFAQTLIDQIRYSPGGHVTLTSDNGDIVTSASSTIDVSQPTGGLASAGEIDISALNGNLVSRSGLGILDSKILGATYGTAKGSTGGIFHLDIGGALASNSLDMLVDSLTRGGFTNEVNIETHTGGLVLDNAGLAAGQTRTLAAQTITLTADSTDPILGRIVLAAGTRLDASGASGGTIEVYARSVDLEGALDAHATTAGQAGGNVTIGTRLSASGQTDATYGFEIVSVQDNPTTGFLDGMLTLGATFSANLSGKADASGNVKNGTLTLRAPLIETTGAGGTPQYNVRINTAANPQTALIGVAAVALDVYATWSTTDNTTGAQHFDGIIDPAGTAAVAQAGADHKNFYDLTLVNFTQNALSQLVAQPSLGVAVPVTTFGTSLPVPLLISPGVVLQNPSTAVNNGDITVASAWNLAAGVIVNPVSGKYSQSASDILFAYRFGYCIPSCTVSASNPLPTYYDVPGNLTLQAVRDINVNASITDGFFDTENLTGVTSTSATQQVVGAIPTGAPTAAATATFAQLEAALLANVSNANGFSPSASSPALASYDLFPSTINMVVQTPGGAGTWATTAAPSGLLPSAQPGTQPNSWSYRLTAGADFSSANPNAMGSLAIYGDNATGALAGHGNVIIDKHTSYSVSVSTGGLTKVTLGPIALPTMVRTGVGDITIDAARNVVLADTSAPGVIYSAGRNAQLPSDFVAPNLFYSGDASTSTTPYVELNSSVSTLQEVKLAGPTTAPAFPVDGGDVVIRAQQDIIGFQNVFASANRAQGSSLVGSGPAYQFYAPWMLTQTSGTTGSGAYVSTSGYNRQTAWWIEFGRFDQGVMSDGGNVTVVAGRDLRDFSVSLPTTGAVSGGQTATSMPFVNLYGSGNMVVRVGRNLYSGSFYEGSGTATISVGGSVQSDWVGQVTTTSVTSTTTNVPISTVLALDTGSINLTAAGSITITDILNPAEVRGFTGTVNGKPATLTMDTYGPNSAVSLTSIGGNVVLNSAPSIVGNGLTIGTLTYPAIVDVAALTGNITTPQSGFLLTDSPSASLSLLAYGSVDLRGGVTLSASNLATFGTIGAGTALVDQAFNPYEPNLWANGTAAATTTPVLAHANDDPSNIYDYIYAATGSILGGPGDIEIPRPVQVRAGLDIIDLNLTAQNIRTSDVSQIIAGRDIRYDAFSVAPKTPNTGGGLQIAGPGFLDVEAGRNLGPFLVSSADYANTTYTQQGIVSSGNAATFLSGALVKGVASVAPVIFPVGNNLYNTKIGIPNALFLGAVDSQSNYLGTQNFLLPSTGATIVAMFGVAPTTDYLGFIQAYYGNAQTAAKAGNAQDLTALVNFLVAAGYNVTKDTSESTIVSIWNGLSASQQQTFLAQADPSLSYATNTAAAGATPAWVGYVPAFANPTNLPVLEAFLAAHAGAIPGGFTPPSGATTADRTNYDLQQFSLLPVSAQQQFVNQIVPAIDYSAIAARYLDPTTAAAYAAGTSSTYLAALETFLNAHGYSGINTTSAAWATWSGVSAPLQHMFLDQVFYGELNRAATDKSNAIGYVAVNTMFPVLRGYTDNATAAGSTLGAPKDQLVQTGNLDILHATIQTDRGGDVDLFGPGGSIRVGSLATEPNSNLKLNNLGLITEGGGNVNTFTDASVLVNTSRVFTEQSGNILMWSSNGDLNAGEGARTSVSLSPLQIFIDNNDFQSINRGGLVTGAGIGTLASSADVPAGNVTLLAPNGTIDAGDAGIRSTGSVTVVAPVIQNAGNISASGSVSLSTAPAIPALTGTTSVSNNTAANTQNIGADATGTAKTSQPSVVIVSILGYGGGDSTPTGAIGGTNPAGATGSTGDNGPAGSGDDNNGGNGDPEDKKRRDDTSG